MSPFACTLLAAYRVSAQQLEIAPRCRTHTAPSALTRLRNIVLTLVSAVSERDKESLRVCSRLWQGDLFTDRIYSQCMDPRIGPQVHVAATLAAVPVDGAPVHILLQVPSQDSENCGMIQWRQHMAPKYQAALRLVHVRVHGLLTKTRHLQLHVL